MITFRTRPLLLTAVALLACAIPLSSGAHGRADAAPDDVLVPDVRSRTVGEARRRLEALGLKVGAIYEVSWERILASSGLRFPVGYVYRQAPAAGTRWPAGRPIRLAVSAVKTGNLPAGLLDALAPLEPRSPIPREDPPSAVPPPAAPPERPPPATEPPPADPPERPPPATEPPPADPPERPPPAVEPPSPLPPPIIPRAEQPPVSADPPADVDPPLQPEGPGDDPPVAVGSPDAPRLAKSPDGKTVPSLIGLELVEAEQLVRDAKMKLYVERVPGHPLGRVLEQDPAPHAPRPAGGVVKIVVTAGGDFEGAVPAAPEVYVPQFSVPDLLDRTDLQAKRILRDLGFVMKREEAKRGLAGRVVDQKPAAGDRIPKGAVVRVWIGPPEPEAPKAPPEPGPAASDAPGAADPKPQPPLDPGPLPGGVPQPLSPGHGTELPKDETVPVGFTWRGVKGARAYIVEVEEEGAEGRWLSNARKPARKTAVLMEIERLGKGRLRWRVRAVIGGREGKPSKWVVLK